MTENDADAATLSWGVPPGSTEEPLSLHRPWAALPCTCTQRPGRHRTRNSELRLHQIPNIPMGALSYCSQIAPSFAFGFQHLSGSDPVFQTSPSGFPDDLVNPWIPVPLESELKHADRSDRHWQTLTGAKRRSCGAIQKCDALCRVCAEFSG